MRISLESAMKKYPGMDVLRIHSIIGTQGWDLLPDGSGWEKKESPAQALGRMGGSAKTEAKAKASAALALLAWTTPTSASCSWYKAVALDQKSRVFLVFSN